MGARHARRSRNCLNAFAGLNFGVVAILTVSLLSLISLSERNDNTNLKLL